MRELELVALGFLIVSVLLLAALGVAFLLMVYGPAVDAWIRRRRRAGTQ